MCTSGKYWIHVYKILKCIYYDEYQTRVTVAVTCQYHPGSLWSNQGQGAGRLSKRFWANISLRHCSSCCWCRTGRSFGCKFPWNVDIKWKWNSHEKCIAGKAKTHNTRLPLQPIHRIRFVFPDLAWVVSWLSRIFPKHCTSPWKALSEHEF